MRRAQAVVGSAVFFVIAPGFVAGLAPYWISGWRIEPPWLGVAMVRWIGGALILLGIGGLCDSFARFALEGRGTPAPPFPTERLVVTGLYRYVRNPIYIALMSTIFGQALLFSNTQLLIYGAAVWLAFHVWVLVYEEPTVRGRFGPQFEAYRAAVPRWIPRLTPLAVAVVVTARAGQAQRLRYSLEMLISLAVMNSKSAGWPRSVASMPRFSAATISAGSVIRSP